MKLAIAVAIIVAGGGLTAIFNSGPTLMTIGGYTTPLKGRTSNQRYNAARALEKLNNVEIGPGKTFSFNASVRSWSRDQGFRKAPVSFSGILVPAYGGGVCQTSTTLYNAALVAGLDVLERHPHRFAPSYVLAGRDAAVAFSSVDLKIRNPYSYPVRIQGEVVHDSLIVRIVASQKPSNLPLIQQEIRQKIEPRLITLASNAGTGSKRMRNSGRAGFEVLIWKAQGDSRTLLSRNFYPVMDRVIEVHEP